ncbi:MAG: bifunctional proline dehydrogenase/L-glutamate gamma-semialdehyde dehydrogenase [Nitrospirae bacterium]|nr:bifunctional proline dehydrogenase/L-glutamate gamma-semialdehyde dehydrogenase [Nitrospirota bacterium]
MKPVSNAEIEKKVYEIGSEIIGRLNRAPSFLSAFTPKGLTESVISLSLKNEQIKTGLFRFIDVLPAVASDTEVIELFLEYLGEHIHDLPPVMRQGLKWLEKGKRLSPIAAKTIRAFAESLASQFIPGNGFEEAIPAIRRIQKSGRNFSIDLLGELTVCHSEGMVYQARYLDLLEQLHLFNPAGKGSQISVKLSSLYHRLDPLDWEESVRASVDRLRPIFRKAREFDTSVILDMESYAYKNLILAILTTLLEEEEFREKPVAGIAIQCYLKDALQDLASLIGWARSKNRPILVRLVKGAYWDYEIAYARKRSWPLPVFTQKSDTDRNFEAAVRLLIENAPLVQPVIGSHHIRTLSYALALSDLWTGRTKDRSEISGPSSHSVELQMLYGMAEPLQKVLVDLGYPLRVYAPIGPALPGMAYLIRRLMENTANSSILLQTFSGKPVDPEILKPAELKADNPLGTSADKPFRTTPESALYDAKAPNPGFQNEPPLDFSVRENREKVRLELNRINERIKQETPAYPLVINGEKVFTQKALMASNPSAPAQVLGKISQASIEQGSSAIEGARKAFIQWRETSPEKRAGLLKNTAREFQKIRHQLIALEILETGKTWREADGDVCEAIDFLLYYAGEIARLHAYYSSAHAVSSLPGEENRLSLQPVGVMAALSPWNFPLALATGMIAAGLAAGNCVIFKPSSRSQILGSKLAELFNAAGAPPGVLQFLPGEGKEIGEFLIRHPDIPLIAFTGSNEVGRHILSVASQIDPGQKQFKKVIAEMGGKNAIIVDESADLDEAISGVIESAFGFQGQKCSACSRVIVHQNIYPEFVRRLGEAASDIVRGDPQSPSTFLGPVIDQKAREKIESYIQIGVKEAKTVYCAGVNPRMQKPHRSEGEEGGGYFIGPAIFEEVSPDSPLAREEIFGPVLSVFKAENFDRALEMANDSPFGLTGGLFSRKPSHLQKAREHFHAGNLYLNRKITGAMVGRQPFGGFNLSGVGMKTGGPDYLLQFMQVKSICENSARRGYIP